MVQFLIGAFVGSIVTFAIMAFMVAVSEDENAVHNKRKGSD